ncbi:MAG: alanine/glycine:cation symporter family protein [Porticoccaceae bacterium]
MTSQSISIDSVINAVNSVIWSPALVYLCLGAGLWFSLRSRFLQVRHFGEMIRLLRTGGKSEAGVSSFQALAMSLSGRVGTGNIAGVATAIAFGGPGAIFWMWVVAFLGAATAFIEATLAQIYKETDDNGLYRGGPAYFIDKALGVSWFAWLFAIATIIAMGFFMPGLQANAIVEGLNNAWGLDKALVSLALTVMLATIVIGGVRRIAAFAQLVVPVMAFIYILMAIFVLAINADKVPAAFKLIFDSAFGLHAGFGAIAGAAVQWGVKRGVYSNEAGQGTGPHHAAAAEVAHPAQQGLVQAFSVYIDTLLICTATALMILVSGLYEVFDGNSAIYSGLAGVAAGPGYVQAALESALPGFGSSMTALALLFFAFTTIVAYYYIAETNVAFINRKMHSPWLFSALKVLILAAVYWGGVKSSTSAWALGDIGLGMMAWLNIIAILLLQKPALLALRDYEKQRKNQQPISFDAQANGIQHAGHWRG